LILKEAFALFSTVMERGGVLMWPLLLCSLLSVTVIVERTIFWFRERRRKNGRLENWMLKQVAEGKFEEIVSMSPDELTAGGRAIRECVVNRDLGMLASFEVAAQEEVERMKRGLSVLDTIITLSPLLGILGTVVGIIESFNMLGAMGIENPRAVTAGIAQALLTTAFGLLVAIVTLIPYNVFVFRVERAVSHLEALGSRLEATVGKREVGHEAQDGV